MVRLFKQGKDKSGPYLPSVSLQKRRSGEDILPSELDEMPDVRAACLAVAVASSKEVPTYFGGRGVGRANTLLLLPLGGIHCLKSLRPLVRELWSAKELKLCGIV